MAMFSLWILSTILAMQMHCINYCISNAAAVSSTRSVAFQASPSYKYGHSHHEFLLGRQSTGLNVVTGVTKGAGSNGKVLIRREIRDVRKDEDAWTLYVLGVDLMQATTQTEKLSWYQIAGIHGRPFLPWDGVQATPGNEKNGYCSHGSILFPTWHRPYLALYEQVLYNLIQYIASLYPEGATRDRYVSTAAKFRIPYWDWAAIPPPGQSVLPESVGGSPYITVDGPAGPQMISNPLFSYFFQTLNITDFPDFPFSEWQQTMRYPTTYDVSAISRNKLVAKQLDNSALSFRNRLYNIFTNYKDYSTFSNDAWIPTNNAEGYDSIEALHDQIHGLSGSGGHMTYIEYSAFDPLFFLHHAMIDRCFAMWQVLNPDSYVVPEPSKYGSFTTSPGQIEDINTPLTPFHRDSSGNFWTSEQVRHTETFGYAYAETAKLNGVAADQLSAKVMTAINTLYGSTAPGNTVQKMQQRSLASRNSTSNSIIHGQYREWIANIRVPKHALDAPFFIHLFLGAFSSDPFTWTFEPNLIGTHCIFKRAAASPGPASPCKNCTNGTMNRQVTATIPLTTSLIQKIQNEQLTSLHPEDVKPFLTANMRYRITMLDDTYVPNARVPDLKISVVSSLVTQSRTKAEFPVWGPLRWQLDVDGAL